MEKKKYHYKYIVDGVWRCDDKAPSERDNKGNTNNILDLTESLRRPTLEINENKDYYIAKPPADHFDVNAQLVPIQFTKNILNSVTKSKLSEHNICHRFNEQTENVSFKYAPQPSHVLL